MQWAAANGERHHDVVDLREWSVGPFPLAATEAEREAAFGPPDLYYGSGADSIYKPVYLAGEEYAIYFADDSSFAFASTLPGGMSLDIGDRTFAARTPLDSFRRALPRSYDCRWEPTAEEMEGRAEEDRFDTRLTVHDTTLGGVAYLEFRGGVLNEVAAGWRPPH